MNATGHTRHKRSNWTTALLANPFDRFTLGPGVAGWVYRHTNAEPLEIPPMVCGANEVAVQLEGQWAVEAWPGERVTFGPRDVFTLDGGVRHAYRIGAGALGLQVGFAVYPHELGLMASRWCQRFFDGPTRRQWLALASEVVRARAGHTPFRQAAIGKEVVALWAVGLRDEAPTGVERACQQLELHLDRPLYLKHLAELAQTHPKTLSRQFLERTGVSPIRWRTEMRLQRAIRLLWSRPELSVRAIAAQVGFDDARFFHRLTRRALGLSPAELGRRV